MLSKIAKYGLKAMTVLAREYGNGPLLVEGIAKKERIPLKLLGFDSSRAEKKRFNKRTKKGKGGGYYLNRLPETLSVGQLIRALDGPLALLPCVSQMACMSDIQIKQNEETSGIRMVLKRNPEIHR